MPDAPEVRAAKITEASQLTYGDLVQWAGEPVLSGHMVFPAGSIGKRYFPQGMDLRVSQGLMLLGGAVAVAALWALIRELFEKPAEKAPE